MIDEQLLLERLTDAAAAQDDLLPRAVADDLAAGRRRLRRRRFLAAGTAVVAAGAVAVATIGLNGVLKDPAQLQLPIATQKAPVAKPKPVDFDKLMKGLMSKHFDPQQKHLNFTTGPFQIDTNLGYRGTQRKVGWNTKGDKGQGMFLIELSRSAKAADSTCGSFFEYGPQPVKCHSVKLPNGGSAMLGRQGRMIEFSYLQPDGEFLYVGVDPVFRNNTTIASADMAVTNEQLFAFATDPALNLPPLTADQQADDDKVKNFAPTVDQVDLTTAEHLPGHLIRSLANDRPGEQDIVYKWSRNGVTADVEVSADPALLVSSCPDQLSVPSCTVVHRHTGKVVEYYEGARTYQGGPKFVMGATYKQPDGDLAAVRVLYDGKKAPAGAITRAQIMDLVTDPALDR